MDKNAKKHFFTCFSLGDLTFSIAAEKRFVLGEISENECVIYDELSFIRYKIDYSGPSSSPDHRVRKLIEFQKDVFIFNGDVMVIAHCFAAYDF